LTFFLKPLKTEEKVMIPVVVIDFAGVAESPKEKLSTYTEKLIKGSNRNV